VRVHERERVVDVKRERLVHRKIILQRHVSRATFAPSIVCGMNSMIFRSTSARKSCHARRVSAFFARRHFVAAGDDPRRVAWQPSPARG